MAHVQDRRKAGRGWVARYTGPDGCEYTKSFARKVDAEDWLGAQRTKIARGEWTDPTAAKTTLAAYYDVWTTRQPWRDSTRSATESMFVNHVLPTFGTRPLGGIRRGDIEDWAAGLPLAGQTARLAVKKISALLESAVDDGYISRNPAHRAKKPVADVAPVVPFTAEEIGRLTAASPDWFAVSITLGIGVGLRQGEATGLTADRIDFLRRTLTVDRQLVTPSNGEPAFGPPKTKRSYRTIPLADVTLDSLAAHIERFGTGDDGQVLHEDGHPVRRQRFGKVWRGLRRRAGLPAARFHDARHTFGALLLSGGVNVAAVADYMGHSPATLLKVYAHLIPADHDRARDVVQEALSTLGRDADGTETGAGASLSV